MSLFDLSATLSLDTSGYISGISTASGKTSGLASTTIAFGQLAAEAVSKVVDAFGDLLTSIVEVGTETETSFAKLETIAGSENIDSLNDSLSELAVNLGTSSAELAETAYQAISAGTSAEDAAEMVETAAKLATAGFTDSTTAVDVLTTAINAYGYSAEDAVYISDSLIQTQNLGKTTVDELASSMGKAIASGSAFGVSLENIESAYVGLTSQGIDTAEATTYMASMIKELGDSSSDVATIIKDETGQSFSELMNSGYSLGDVLQILYDYCEGDTDAMQNLWSSAEAGMASNALVMNGLEDFNDVLEQIASSSGTTEDAYAIMTDTMEFKMSVLKTSFEELGNSIFDELEPGLNTFIDFVTDTIVPALQEFADNIDFSGILESVTSFLEEKVIPAISFLVDNIDSIIPIVEGVIAAFVAYKVAVTAVNTVQAIMNALMNASPLGLIVTTISLLVGMITVLIANWDQVTETMANAWETIKGIFSGVGEWFGEKFSAAKELIQKAWEGYDEFWSGVWDGISGFFSNVGNWFSEKFSSAKELAQKAWDGYNKFWSSVWDGISGVFSNVGSWFSEKFTAAKENTQKAWSNITDWFSEKWKAIQEVFSNAKEKFKEIGKNLIAGIKQGITDAWSSFKQWVTDKFTGIINSVKSVFGISSPSKVFAEIGDYLVEGLAEGIDETANEAVDAAETMASSVLSAVDGMADEWNAGIDSMTTDFEGNIIRNGTVNESFVETVQGTTGEDLSKIVMMLEEYMPFLKQFENMTVVMKEKVVAEIVMNEISKKQRAALAASGK